VKPRHEDRSSGLSALRAALHTVMVETLDPGFGAAPCTGMASGTHAMTSPGRNGFRLFSEAVDHTGSGERGWRDGRSTRDPSPFSVPDEGERLAALVERARDGDPDAFGSLYDHYHPSVYRYVYYRVGSVSTAEELTSDTFLRALRAIGSFSWQGKDFGAWLTTIARNLTLDHFKSARVRWEASTDDLAEHDAATEGPESQFLEAVTNRMLLEALGRLPHDQQECLVMRFLQGLSITETARVLGRTDGAVKQLQLRAVRRLARELPRDGL
jgi:RNA polymerase sigma-70 factor (ECF subfamily)